MCIKKYVKLFIFTQVIYDKNNIIISLFKLLFGRLMGCFFVNCHGVTGASRKQPPILGYTVDKCAFTQINIDTLICVLRKYRYSSTYKD